MVEQVMTVQAKEYAGAFDVALLGQVHAPVKILIRGIICHAGQSRAAPQSPFPEQHRYEKKWQRA